MKPYLTALLSLVFVVSCNNNKPDITQQKYWHELGIMYGPVTRVIESCTVKVVQPGVAQEERKPVKNVYEIFEDARKQTKDKGDGYTETIFYDKNGRIDSLFMYAPGREPFVVYYHKVRFFKEDYNHYNSHGTYTYYLDIDYSARTVKNYSREGEPMFDSFDKSGLLVKHHSKIVTETYEYNEYGHRTRTIAHYDGLTDPQETTCSYEYDKNGNWTRKTEKTVSKDPKYSVTAFWAREIFYDEQKKTSAVKTK